MADLANVGEVKSDLWKVKIGADWAPFHVGLKLGAKYAVEKITTGRTGTTPIGNRINGSECEGSLTLNQSNLPMMRTLLGIGATGLMLAAGAELPARVVVLHDPTLADDVVAGDITLLAAVFTAMEHEHDGEGLRELEFPFFLQKDEATGSTLRIGAAI